MTFPSPHRAWPWAYQHTLCRMELDLFRRDFVRICESENLAAANVVWMPLQRANVVWMPLQHGLGASTPILHDAFVPPAPLPLVFRRQSPVLSTPPTFCLLGTCRIERVAKRGRCDHE